MRAVQDVNEQTKQQRHYPRPRRLSRTTTFEQPLGTAFEKQRLQSDNATTAFICLPYPWQLVGIQLPLRLSCIYSSRPQQETEEESHHVTFREGTRALDSSNRRLISASFLGEIPLDALPSSGLLTLRRITGTRGALMPNRQLTGACHSLASIPLIRERIATMCRCSLEA